MMELRLYLYLWRLDSGNSLNSWAAQISCFELSCVVGMSLHGLNLQDGTPFMTYVIEVRTSCEFFWTRHPYKTCPIRFCCRQDLFWQWPIDLFALSRALLLSEAAGSFACSSCHSGILTFVVSFRKLPARRCWEVLPAMPETCVEPHSVLLV